MTTPYVKINYINIPVELIGDDKQSHDTAVEIITDTLTMFNIPKHHLAGIDPSIANTFELLQACYTGKKIWGVMHDAEYFLNRVAKYFNWSRSMDMSNTYNQRINQFYNPNKIHEQCKLFNRAISNRKKALNGERKITVISDLVSRMINKGTKRILVINSSTDVCNTLVTTINNLVGGYLVAPYHSSIPSAHMLDDDGNYITYKSGDKKGQPKMFGATSLKKHYMQSLSENKLKAIITTGNLDSDFSMDNIEAVIHTDGNATNIFVTRKSGKCKSLTLGGLDKKLSYINIYYAETKEEDKILSFEPAMQGVYIDENSFEKKDGKK